MGSDFNTLRKCQSTEEYIAMSSTRYGDSRRASLYMSAAYPSMCKQKKEGLSFVHVGHLT